MKWWKKALVASLIWAALIGLWVWFVGQRIDKLAESPEHAEAWENKMSETSGMLLGAGLVLIWVILWRRERQKLKG